MSDHCHKAYYGLPSSVKYCSECVISNQRPSSIPEFTHQRDSLKPTIQFDEFGVCDACNQNKIKANVNWQNREQKLLKLLDKHRKNNGDYDCIVPGSGGKDSAFAAHVLKYKYGMNPLTVTWPPILYTDYGLANFNNWLSIGGFANYSCRPNGRAMKILTRLSIENLFHPFQTFILGQKNIAARIATELGIPLVFYGENEAEYGNPLADNSSSTRDPSFFSNSNVQELFLAGQRIKEICDNHDLSLNDLMPFLPIEDSELQKSKVEVHYLGYYLKWSPQEIYYYAVENTGFKARPFRTQGTYSKYNSIDDKIDDLHYYTTFIKFGIGRATYDASQEIRNGHLSREEGIALVSRFDGEYPDKYIEEILDYVGISLDDFFQLADTFRSPHLWRKVDNKWQLRHTVAGTGCDD